MAYNLVRRKEDNVVEWFGHNFTWVDKDNGGEPATNFTIAEETAEMMLPEAGFEYSIIPGSFNANRIPFLDIRHSKKKGNVDLYQYYRYANNPHPILKGIDENEDYL